MITKLLFIVIFTTLFLLNVVAFWLYGADKRKAVYNLWRIPEALLLILAIVGGSYGAGCGMLLFWHKTNKPLFFILVPLCFILQMAAIVFLILKTPNLLFV